MSNSEEKCLANMEEVTPRPPSAWEELPLVLFTLLGQTAVGGLWAISWMFSTLWALVEYDAMSLRLLPLLFLCGCLGMGMLASLAHLGNRKNAWRVFSNLKHSSLSKEVLYTCLFGLGLFLVFLSIVLHQDFHLSLFIAAAAGLGLVYHMAEVYRIPAAPGWNTWRTNTGFLLSTLLLGVAAMAPFLFYESGQTGIRTPSVQWTVMGLIMLTLLLVQFALMLRPAKLTSIQILRMGCILTGVALAAIAFYLSDPAWIILLVSVAVIGEEILGRWLFYRSRM